MNVRDGKMDHEPFYFLHSRWSKWMDAIYANPTRTRQDITQLEHETDTEQSIIIIETQKTLVTSIDHYPLVFT